MRTFTFPLLTGALALAAACGGSSYGGGTTNTPTEPTGTPVMSATVSVQNNFFDPASVLLASGGTVTWNWVGSGHSVTSMGTPSFSPSAPVSNAPHTLVVTFSTAGDYDYYCTVHGVSNDPYNGAAPMTGVIQVH